MNNANHTSYTLYSNSFVVTILPHLFVFAVHSLHVFCIVLPMVFNCIHHDLLPKYHFTPNLSSFLLHCVLP